MCDAEKKRLSEALQRGRLSPEEEARLQAYLLQHPEERSLWEEERGLNLLLKHLPSAPVSSNFTARVCQAVEHLERQFPVGSASRWQHWLAGKWIPRLTVTSALLCLGLFSYQQYQLATRRELARSVAEMSEVATLPTLDLLSNFEAIQQLAHVPRDSDARLIAALQSTQP